MCYNTMKHHNYSSGIIYTLYQALSSFTVLFSNCTKAQESWLQSEDIGIAKENAWLNNGTLWLDYMINTKFQ